MADSNYILTYTLKLEPGSVASDAATAGKQAGDAFGTAFKPDIQLTKAFDAEAEAKKIVGGFKKTFQGLNMAAELEKSFSGFNFARTDFGKSLDKSFQDAVSKIQPTIPATTPPTAVPAGPSIAQYAQPLVSGMEAFAMLLRGAPLLSVAQMAGQAITAAQSLYTAQRVATLEGAGGGGPPRPPAGGGPILIPPAGPAGAARAAAETDAARIDRRLTAIPGAVPALPAASLMATLIRGGTFLGGVGAVVGGVDALGDAVEDLGKKGAHTIDNWENMSKTMGMSMKQFIEMRFSMANAGVSADSMDRAFYRLAINAQRQMPAIRQEVEEANDKTIESNIAVDRSHRAVAKAQDDRVLAAQRINKAEGEVERFQATRAQEREQQARGAELAVSGAQIGLTGAQMQRRQAEIQRMFAPQEAAIADIRGPQTVEGARLGATGARIGLAEARARFEGRDPAQDEDLQERKRIHALRIARHNVDQAELHEREAQLAEEKRQTQKAAGVGPEAQAQQAARAAAQAEQQAQLHTEQTQTARTNLEITQRRNTLAMEDFEVDAKLRQSKRDYLDALDQTPEVQARQAERRAARLISETIPNVQEMIKGRPTPEGFKPLDVSPDTFRKAFFMESGGAVADMRELLHETFQRQQEQGVPRETQLARLRGLAGRGFQGPELEDALSMFQKPIQELTENQRKLRDRMLTAIEKEHEADRSATIKRLEAQGKAASEGRAVLTEAAAGEQTVQELQNKFAGAIADALKLGGVQLLTGADKMFNEAAAEAGSNMRENAGKIKEVSDAIPGAIKEVADKIRGTETKPEEKPEAEGGVKKLLDALGLTTPKPAEPTPAPTPVPDTPVPVTPVPPSVTPEPSATFGERFDASQAEGAVNGAGSDLANALRQKASEIAAIQIQAPQQSGGGGGAPTEATEQAAGGLAGLLHGAGTGTSDSIPINASAGEYIVTAERTSQLGVPFLDALNEGRINFAEGGEVKTTSRKLSREETISYLTKLWAQPNISRRDQRTLNEIMDAMSPVGAAVGKTKSDLDRSFENLSRLIGGGSDEAGGGLIGFAEGGAVKNSDLGAWLAILKSAQWGAWIAQIGLPAVGVAIPAAVDVALQRTNPAIGAMLALKALWDETHSHPPMTLGEVLREQRGGLSVGETIAKHFAETRQATFDERFGQQPSAEISKPPEMKPQAGVPYIDEQERAGGLRDELLAAGLDSSYSADENADPTLVTAKAIVAPPIQAQAQGKPVPKTGGGGPTGGGQIARAQIAQAQIARAQIARGQIAQGQIATGVATPKRIENLFTPYGPELPRYIPETGPVPGFTDTGPAIGGVTPVVPSGGETFVTNALGPGDRILRKGSGGDQRYFGANDYSIPAKNYVGGQDVADFRRSERREEERRRREEQQDNERQDYASGGLVGFANGGSLPDQNSPEFILQKEQNEYQRRVMRSLIGGPADPVRPVGNIDISGALERLRGRRGMQAGGAVSEEEFAKLSKPAEPTQFVKDAMADLSRHMVQGFINPIVSSHNNPNILMAGGAGGGGMGAPAGYHQLDLITPAGRISAAVSQNTVEALQRTATAGKMVQTGPRPSWYS